MAALLAPFMSSDQYCTGKDNWPSFEESFRQACEARGLILILDGNQTCPLDTAGNITGTSTTSKLIHTTPLGSAKPTIAEFNSRERTLNLAIKTCIPDADSYGYVAKDSAADNWTLIKAHLSKISVVEQDQARKALVAKHLNPMYEEPKEYENHVNAWHVLRRKAISYGVKFEDSMLKTLFILSLDGDDYVHIGGAIPESDTLMQLIEKLKVTWLLKHSKRLEQMETESRVVAMTASIAASASKSKGKRGQGCTNPIHGPPGNFASTKHDLDHCWSIGGGDYGNRPAHFRDPKSKKPSTPAAPTPAAASAVASNVTVSAVDTDISIPNIFVLSVDAQLPSSQLLEDLPVSPRSLESRLMSFERPSLTDRMDIGDMEDELFALSSNGPLNYRISDTDTSAISENMHFIACFKDDATNDAFMRGHFVSSGFSGWGNDYDEDDGMGTTNFSNSPPMNGYVSN
ncbi:hypothetical protein C8J56DRAFT_964257 [Mycena floridula]|nr:hypothetical protein C8J56DRAFT_964257 [Mycena floridula]